MISFTVMGRPQQRGSKNPRNIWDGAGNLVMRKDEVGNPIRGKNGRPIPLIVVPDDNPKSIAWMKLVGEAAAKEMGDQKPIRGPVTLTLHCFFARPKSHFGTGRNALILKDKAPEFHVQYPDASKLLRAVEDAMTGIVYSDDRQIVGYEGVRRVRWWCSGDWDERAEIKVWDIGDSFQP